MNRHVHQGKPIANTQAIHRNAARALAGAGLLVALAGWITHQMWQFLPWERLALSLLLAGAATLLALPVRRLLKTSMTTALLLLWLAAIGFFAGASSLLSAALLGAAALALGSRLVGQRPSTAPLALSLGLVLIGGPSGWLLSFPIHRDWVWLLLLLIPIALFRRSLQATVGAVHASWNSAIAASPRAAAMTILLLGLASTGLWFPTLQADDVAYHLGLPSQLIAQARYQPLPEIQMWSYAPWLGDTLHGMASVLAGGDARGGVNFLWLISASAALASLSFRLRTEATFAWSVVAVFASFPPLVWLTAGMQTELPAMALVLSLLFALLTPNLRGRQWIAVTLFAGLLALKPIHAITALPLMIWAGWRYRADIDLRIVLGVPLLLMAIAGSSYLQAWLLTGNPLLPLLNGFFQSSSLPNSDIADPRWHAGFDATLPWRLVFDSARYFEGWNGALGFSLVALAGGSLLTLGDKALRGAVTAVVIGMALTLLPMQYARYAFPSMVLLAALSLPAVRNALGSRLYGIAVVVLCIFNLAFQANASWLHHSAALKRIIRTGGDASELFVNYLPERELIRRHDNGTSVWLATDSTRYGIAELDIRSRTLSTQAPLLLAQRELAERDASGKRWRSLIRSQQPQWLLVSTSTASPALRRAIQGLEAARLEDVGDVELWQMPPSVDQ